MTEALDSVRPKVLLVDDRPENLVALEAVLEPMGHELLRATSGEEALRLVLRHDFAVVLMDVQMPGMNGFETVRTIRSRERSVHLPIIFLTAISKEQKYVEEGYSVGAVDYVFKPFDPFILKSKVAVFIELYRKNQLVQRQEAELREATERALRSEHEATLQRKSAEAAHSLREVNEALTKREEDLKRAMESRSRFYANMSHELRTPINAILGYSSLLADNIYGPLNEKQKNGVSRTQRAARHLLELVNDILDLSKIEAGKLELSLGRMAPVTLIQELLVTVEPTAKKAGCDLQVKVEGEPPMITTDERRVRQILLNLLSNAIKFGSGKPVIVGCSPGTDDGVVITVVDHGRGIREEDQEKIFEEFVQVHSADEEAGTGLGLPISLRLAQLLGGSLHVRSAEGEGSEFKLTLPPRWDVKSVPEPHRVGEVGAGAA